MSRIIIAALAVVVFLSGCAAKVASVPIGGSRADGTITLAYEGAVTRQCVRELGAPPVVLPKRNRTTLDVRL